MNSPVIVVENLGKKYKLSHQQGSAGYKTLSDTVAGKAKTLLHPSKWFRPWRDSSASEDFWALQDVSFELRQGEVLGVIGRNGAGKSTLLKVLSGITDPTTGRVRLRGRVACLLEVGTGFHPELTGRENIFLNGAILGMQRREIRKNFDEIVAFAGVERFLDTPVKRYSSGMYVRLAFAVAAHLEPEILIVDEVLAVGDAAFQKKCLQKMSDVARTGRTILFVSHNLPAVINLCTRVVSLNAGRVVTDGDVSQSVESYLASFANAAAVPLNQRTDRKGNRALLFERFHLENAACEPVAHARSGEDLYLVLSYICPGGMPLRGVHVAIAVNGQFDEKLFHLATSTTGTDFEELPTRGEVRCLMPKLPLQPGRYTLNLWCSVQGEVSDWLQSCCAFDVEGGDFFGTGKLPGSGSLLVDHSWQASSII